MYGSVSEASIAGEPIVESSLKGKVERQILELIDGRFKGSATLVDLELMMRLPREDMAQELENLHDDGLITNEVHVTPGSRPYMSSRVFRITDKGINVLQRLNGDTSEDE